MRFAIQFKVPHSQQWSPGGDCLSFLHGDTVHGSGHSGVKDHPLGSGIGRMALAQNPARPARSRLTSIAAQEIAILAGVNHMRTLSFLSRVKHFHEVHQ